MFLVIRASARHGLCRTWHGRKLLIGVKRLAQALGCLPGIGRPEHRQAQRLALETETRIGHLKGHGARPLAGHPEHHHQVLPGAGQIAFCLMVSQPKAPADRMNRVGTKGDRLNPREDRRPIKVDERHGRQSRRLANEIESSRTVAQVGRVVVIRGIPTLLDHLLRERSLHSMRPRLCLFRPRRKALSRRCLRHCRRRREREQPRLSHGIENRHKLRPIVRVTREEQAEPREQARGPA